MIFAGLVRTNPAGGPPRAVALLREVLEHLPPGFRLALATPRLLQLLANTPDDAGARAGATNGQNWRLIIQNALDVSAQNKKRT